MVSANVQLSSTNHHGTYEPHQILHHPPVQSHLVPCPDSTSPASRQFQLMAVMVMVHELMIEFPNPTWSVSCHVRSAATEGISSTESHLIVFNVKFNFLLQR